MLHVTLSNVQGNILKGFNKPNLRLIFFKFGDPHMAMKWLMDIAKRIPSTIDLIEASNKYRKKRETIRNYYSQDIWLHVSLSKSGLVALDLKFPPSTGIYKGTGRATKLEKPVGEPKAYDPFKQGMKKRWKKLGDTGDSEPKNWVEPFRDKQDKTRKENLSAEIDALFIVAADHKNDLDIYTSGLIEEATHEGFICVGMEIGKALENEQGKQVEHFGFRDGVSQPLIVGVDKKDIKDRKLYKDRFYPQDFVLSGLTGNYGWANNGSFLVFRKLQQDVPKFWEVMGGHSTPPEELAAKLLGRWKSGAPLDGNPDHDPVAPEYSDLNDFRYLADKNAVSINDPRGEKTPTFSHIRVANPRDDKSRYLGTRGIGTSVPKDNLKFNAQHRILRRGIPYGPAWAKKERETKKGEAEIPDKRGLLFICYQRDIAEQFEEIQLQWSFYQRKPNYSSADNRDRKFRDAHEDIVNFLRGQAREGGKEFQGGLEQFVTTKGGGYFFSPSIYALKNLNKYSKLKA